MKLSDMPSIALQFMLACGLFTNVALAMNRHEVPNFRNARFRAPPPDDSPTPTSTILNATFEQLIDHDNPSLGTFSQFYYYSTDFYKGPGSPVVSSTKIRWQIALPVCV